MAEFFDLAELPLNTEGQTWGNLGYWEHATDYSDACRALATLLGDAAQLDENSVIMDAGFGCGDQLLHWLEHFGAKSVSGINLSQSQTELAQSRLLDAGHDEAAASISQGDVGDPACWEALRGIGINRVLALDCAYHFPDRAAFIQHAADLLPEGGRLCLTDFLLADAHQKRSLRGLALAPMLRASRIPPSNLVALEEYKEQLQGAGFREVQTQDISQWVMQGFRAWLVGFRLANPGRMPRRQWLKYQVTSSFLDWAYRNQVLHYRVISAVR